MVPKNFRTNININPTKIGPERRYEMLEDISEKGTYLPRGVSLEDMDETFLEYMNNRLTITVDGEKVPVVFMTIQRWSEFTKTWKFSDEYKNITLPFITVVRNTDVQVGENQGGFYNIPGDRTYAYYKVPTWDGIRSGVDLYKVPQPTPVDLTYNVRLFTTKLRDTNKFNSRVHRNFQSIQSYINVKGHPMPLMLESVGEENNIDDFENRRFYVHLTEIRLLGYILDEEDFEVIPTINRVVTVTEINNGKSFDNPTLKITTVDNTTIYTFKFNLVSSDEFSFNATSSTLVNELTNIDNLYRIEIYINNILIFDGISLTESFNISNGDNVKIKVYKTNLSLAGRFQLIGDTI